MTLKGFLHCSAIIIEVEKVNNIRSVALNIFQQGFVCCQELNFISDVGEMGFVSSIEDAIKRRGCIKLPKILAGPFDCDMSGLVKKGITWSFRIV